MRRQDRHPFASRFAISTVLLFVVAVMWGLASPVPSGPDEEAQLIKAAALAHGTLIGTPLPGTKSKGTATVTVPRTVVNPILQNAIACSYSKVDHPVCTVKVASDPQLVPSTTYEARYPPLYYAITGIPWLFTSDASALRWMRVAAAAIVAVLLGLAFATVSAYGRSGLLTVATGVIITPTVLYLGGVVNPSGMEVAGGIAVWAALVVAVWHHSDDPPLPVLATLVVGSIGLCASRPLSTLWLALALLTVVLLRPAACLRLVRRNRARVAVGASLLVAVASGIYVLVVKSYEIEAFSSRASTTSGYLLAVAGHGPKVLDEVIGAFGAPDFFVPLPVEMVWLVGCIGVIAAAVLLVGGRQGVVLAVLTVVFGAVLPFAVIYSHVHTDGVIWQGRYSLPLIAGLPLSAAAMLQDRWPEMTAVLRRLAPTAMVAWAAGMIGGFYWFLRRYTVGLDFYATNAFRRSPGAWRPPLGAPTVFVVTVVAVVVFAAWLLRQALRVPGAVGAPLAPAPDPTVRQPSHRARRPDRGPRPDGPSHADADDPDVTRSDVTRSDVAPADATRPVG